MLVYEDGTLTLVRHNETVKEVQVVTTRQTSGADFQYYKGITFSGIEYSSSSSASGGAIYGRWSSTITLSNNGSVVFEGNTASSSSYSSYAYGGAIYGGNSSTITLSNNGSVVFEGNTASSSSTDAMGGAIEKLPGGVFSIQNNKSVVFKGNYTLNSGALRLQSIYASDLDEAEDSLIVLFSAPEQSSIEFRDSIHIDVASNSSSAFHLNDWYEAENWEKIAQTGDIIFSGADANAEFLKAILDKRGLTATEEQMAEYIAASRTSEIWGVAQLHDGRLIIRDGAVLEADGIKVLASTSGKSTPTLWLHNGKLTSYFDSTSRKNALSFASGTAFTLSGQNAARNTTITFAQDSSSPWMHPMPIRLR